MGLCCCYYESVFSRSNAIVGQSFKNTSSIHLGLPRCTRERPADYYYTLCYFDQLILRQAADNLIVSTTRFGTFSFYQ